MDPTATTYGELQLAYDTFNRELFEGKLTGRCLITLQREARSMGYFSKDRFGSKQHGTTHEMALNPEYFGAVPLLETLQTLAHEMCHLYQEEQGSPGRGRYHNGEFASIMEKIGLMASSTGRPGGKRTGDRMADYPIRGGPFLDVCADLLRGPFTITWFDRFPSFEARIPNNPDDPHFLLVDELPESAFYVAAVDPVVRVQTPSARQAAAASGGTGGTGGALVAPVDKSNRVKYSCACGFNVWGKPGLRLRCEDCNEAFAAAAS